MENTYTENLREILRSGVADDFAVVCEIYPSDATPEFNPNNAIKRYAMVSGVTFFGATYERLITGFGTIKRSTSASDNNSSVTLDNLENAASNFELAGIGFEGLIQVIRLISRSKSLLLSDSLVLCANKCKKPNSGNRKQMSVSAQHILGGTEAAPEMLRRRFSPDDAEGRHPSDPHFEGFRFSPQYGTVSYSVREKRGGLLGFLGFKKTVTITLQFSSYSDIDASKFLPRGFGRVQVIGTHLGYVDIGTYIRMTTAFLEGEVAAYSNFRSVTPPFYLNPGVGAIVYRYGKLGGVDDQFPYYDAPGDTQQPANGYYSRTALIFSAVQGTAANQTDPAPDMVSVILAQIMAVPNVEGIWQDTDWTDDGAAQTRFVLTDKDIFNLASAWLDDGSFYEVFKFNNEIIFDSSYSDTLFVPSSFYDNAGNLTSAGAATMNLFLRSTAICSPEFFQYLNKDKSLAETFLLPPKTESYDVGNPIPIDPNPEDPGPGGPGNPTPTANLLFFLRRRYVSNVVITEQVKAIDFLQQSLLPASRMYFSQAADGRLKLNSKKPVDWALGTAAFAENSSVVALDDVSAWISNKSGHLLIDPHTAQSEVRTVIGANYSTAQNVVALSTSSNINIDYSFAAHPTNSADIPAEARLNVSSVSNDCFVNLDGVEIAFVANEADTEQTIAAFIYGSINGHPVLRRKFTATWAAGEARVYIRAKFGTLTLNSALQLNHAAPIGNPTDAPGLTDAGGGTLKEGTYTVAYAYQNERGQTLLSPFQTITLSANQRIAVSGISLPGGATNVAWYCSPAANSRQLRLVNKNNGADFFIEELPRVSAPLPSDYNRTGAEVLRVAAVFSDREEIRSDIGQSNVLKGTFEFQPERKNPINQVEVTWRDATQDFKLSRIILRDDEHIKKTGKVSKKEINGQAIDSHHQAYRIASGELAENRDADFFYRWSGDREALLLEEGVVVAITDAGSGVINFPVRIENFDINPEKGFPKIAFNARKYSTTLYDDSVAERQIPVIVETGSAQNLIDYENEYKYIPSNFTPTRELNATTASFKDVVDVVGTIMDDLQNKRK